jgi:hypothetical protein
MRYGIGAGSGGRNLRIERIEEKDWIELDEME